MSELAVREQEGKLVDSTDGLFHIFLGDIIGRPVLPGEAALCGQWWSGEGRDRTGPARPDDCAICLSLYVGGSI